MFFKKENKPTDLIIILSIISILVVIVWIISDYFGGLVFHLLMYFWIIFPSLIVYIVSGIITIIKSIKFGIKNNKILLAIHTIALISILVYNIYESELFKSRILIDSILLHNYSRINIKLREGGHFNTSYLGIDAYKTKFSGKYILKNDTLIFLDRHYYNDYIPDTVLINKIDSVIYFKKDKSGKFIKAICHINYIKIITINK